MMNEIMKKLTESANFKKVYGGILLSVILLVAINVFTPNEKQKEVRQDGNFTQESIITYYEGRLEDILNKVEGAGKVDVMITLEGSGEKIYAVEQKRNNSENTNTIESKTTLVSKGSGVQEPIVIKETIPQIKGVLVVCEGGGNKEVELLLTKGVKTLLDISMSKIFVIKRIN